MAFIELTREDTGALVLVNDAHIVGLQAVASDTVLSLSAPVGVQTDNLYRLRVTESYATVKTLLGA
jgi:hypothetical protein